MAAASQNRVLALKNHLPKPSAGRIIAERIRKGQFDTMNMKSYGKSRIKLNDRAVKRALAISAFVSLLIAGMASAQNLIITESKPSGNVYEYTPSGVLQSTIVNINEPAYMAFNSAGDLFIGGFNNAWNITEMTPSGGESTFGSLDEPNGLAFDSAGDLFEADLGSGKIYEYTNHDGTLSSNATLFASGLNDPAGLAFDSAGDLFAANNQTGTIYEYTNHDGTLNPTSGVFASGLQWPSGLAFNGSGDLFEADAFTGKINEFTPGGKESTFASGFSDPIGVAIDSAGNLFVADINSGTVTKITPSGAKSTFASGLSSPAGVTFQPVPNLQEGITNGTIQTIVTMPSPYYSTVLQ
ncbi:MAG: NHL repeat-containing protein, partial [Limisphaerales bacterium]